MNLAVLYPHYLFFGMGSDFPPSASGYDGKNVVNGSRQLYFKRSSAAALSNWTTDIGPLPTSQRLPDYVYFAGLNLSTIQSNNVKVKLTGASDNTFTSDVIDVVDHNVASLTDAEDLIVETTDSEARRYWTVSITKTSGSPDYVQSARKIYFGQWWHPGAEPDAPVRINYIDSPRKQRLQVRLSWSGVSDANLMRFFDHIYRYRLVNPVVLYCREWPGLLSGRTLLHCILTDAQIQRGQMQRNVLACTFLELL